MDYLKLIGAGVALVLAFMLGHHVSTNKSDVVIANLTAKHAGEVQKLNDEFGAERTSWANERANINKMASEALANQVTKAAKKEAELRAAKDSAETKYRTLVKEKENERIKAASIIADRGPTGGLWVNVDGSTCTGNAAATGGGDNRLSVSASIRGALRPSGATQCRLSDETSQYLVEEMNRADGTTLLLNKCIAFIEANDKILTRSPSTEVPIKEEVPK